MTTPATTTDPLQNPSGHGVRLVTSLVIVALAGGIALLWPSVQSAVVDRFGPFFPARFLIADLLGLVALFVVYLWRKSSEIEQLAARLLSERSRLAEFEHALAQARAVLEASAQVELEADADKSLARILHCVTEAMRAERGILWRLRRDGRMPQREAVFPSRTQAPDPLVLAFEDEVARKVVETGSRIEIDAASDLAALGIEMTRPRRSARRLLAAPLLVEGAVAGVLLLDNPEQPSRPDGAASAVPERLSLIDVFAGFAAGVLRNLRLFRTIAHRNEELVRARQLLCDHQRELAEIDAVATMTRVARTLAHGLSGPLTAIAGFTDVVLAAAPRVVSIAEAQRGLRREIESIQLRLQRVVDFAQTWRRSYRQVDLNQLLESVVALEAEPLRARGVSCRFEPHAGLPLTVADPVRIRQVFLSLFAFVRASLPDDSAAEVGVRTLVDSGVLRIRLDFVGRPGLAAIHARALDPNIEISGLPGTRSVDLQVAVSILRDHRGDLTIESPSGHATCVEVRLPVLHEAPCQNVVPVSSDESLESALERILVEPLDAPAAAKDPYGEQELGSEPTTSPRPTSDVQSGIDELFGVGEIWHGSKPSIIQRPAASDGKPPRRTSLLQQADVAGALSLFDQIDSAPRPPKT